MRIAFSLSLFEGKFKHLFNRSGATRWPHKFWEIEAMQVGIGNIISFEFAWTRKTDHAGVRLGLGLLGFEAYGMFYDSRHWDDEKNDWVAH